MVIYRTLNQTSTLNIEMAWIYNRQEITAQTSNDAEFKKLIEIHAELAERRLKKPILDVSPIYARNRYLS